MASCTGFEKFTGSPRGLPRGEDSHSTLRTPPRSALTAQLNLEASPFVAMGNTGGACAAETSPWHRSDGCTSCDQCRAARRMSKGRKRSCLAHAIEGLLDNHSRGTLTPEQSLDEAFAPPRRVSNPMCRDPGFLDAATAHEQPDSPVSMDYLSEKAASLLSGWDALNNSHELDVPARPSHRPGFSSDSPWAAPDCFSPPPRTMNTGFSSMALDTMDSSHNAFPLQAASTGCTLSPFNSPPC